jgi:hypothetical protein
MHTKTRPSDSRLNSSRGSSEAGHDPRRAKGVSKKAGAAAETAQVKSRAGKGLLTDRTDDRVQK